MDARASTRPRSHRKWSIIGGGVALMTAAAVIFSQSANAATEFSATFEDGSISSWSKSGGTWVVGTDGSRVAQQTNTGSENARLFNASTSLTNYTVQARVKPVSLGSNGFVSLLARSSGSTTFYRLALLTGRAELQAVNGGSVTVLGSSSRTIANGTWYTLAITTNGTTISGSINGAQFATGTSSVSSAGRIGLQTSFSSALYDDVLVTTGGTTTPTTPPTTPSGTTRPPTPNPTTSTSAPSTPTPTVTAPPGNAGGLVGFATLSGYGRTGTNGGTGGPTVTVTNYAQLAAAIADDSPRIVRVSGIITGDGAEMLDVRSNKTIIGVGSNATIS